MFLGLCFSALPLMAILPPDLALMAGFDVAALAFLASLRSLYRHDQPRMRSHARDNDANRVVMLVVTVVVMLVLLVLVASELTQRGAPSAMTIALIHAGPRLDIRQYRLRASLCLSLLQQGCGGR
jgi:uncharacterized membrane protein